MKITIDKIKEILQNPMLVKEYKPMFVINNEAYEILAEDNELNELREKYIKLKKDFTELEKQKIVDLSSCVPF